MVHKGTYIAAHISASDKMCVWIVVISAYTAVAVKLECGGRVREGPASMKRFERAAQSGVCGGVMRAAASLALYLAHSLVPLPSLRECEPPPT